MVKDETLFRRDLEDDGLQTPEVGKWALEKYRPHAYYAQLFTDAMKDQWEQLCYIGLCSGSGRAQIRETGEIVESSAMAVMRLEHPFTKYIFCDEDPKAIASLRERAECMDRSHDVAYITGDVNEEIDRILEEMPRFSRNNRLLSFCFLDPFASNIRFETIRTLGGARKVDFLLLLASMDIRRNFEKDYLREDHPRIDEFLGDPDWRQRWEESTWTDSVPFLADEFSSTMEELGYLPTNRSEMRTVENKKNSELYRLAFYSENDLGKKFWREAEERTAVQQRFDL